MQRRSLQTVLVMSPSSSRRTAVAFLLLLASLVAALTAADEDADGARLLVQPTEVLNRDNSPSSAASPALEEPFLRAASMIRQARAAYYSTTVTRITTTVIKDK